MGTFSSNKKRQMENIDATCINFRVMFILDVKEFPRKSAPLGFHKFIVDLLKAYRLIMSVR